MDLICYFHNSLGHAIQTNNIQIHRSFLVLRAIEASSLDQMWMLDDLVKNECISSLLVLCSIVPRLGNTRLKYVFLLGCYLPTRESCQLFGAYRFLMTTI